MLHPIDNPNFKVGQVWAYNTRPNETHSRLTIVKTERDDKLGSIVHIHLQGLQMKNPQEDFGLTSEIIHLPCDEKCVTQSVTYLLQENVALPEYEEGYWEWRKSFDAGHAGVWGIPVFKMVEAMEIVLNQAQSQSPSQIQGAA